MEQRGSKSPPLIAYADSPIIKYNFIGFAHQSFGTRVGGTGVASAKSCWKLPACLAEPIPGGCKDRCASGQGWANRNGGNAS